jgi:hypothetical protein
MESNINPSQDLELVTVFESTGGSTEDSEVVMVQQLLESNGIRTVRVGDNPLPNFSEAIRVTTEDAARAKQLIAEALAAGPAGAYEAEKESEK